MTNAEQRELIAISDQIEIANARRANALIQLAQLRHTLLETLIDQLGIQPPSVE